MGQYWLVVPNPTHPSLAVNFEIFGEVHAVRSANEATAVSEQQGDPVAVVIGVPVDGLAQRVEWFRHQYPHSRLYLAGFIPPFQLGGLDITLAVPIPLPPDFIKTVRTELDLDDTLGHVLPAAPASYQPIMPVVQQETAPKEPVGKDQIIAVFSGKGGDGKTTVSAQLGILLAKRGHSVLIIDADYKGNEAEWFRGMKQPPIHSILDFRTEEEKDRSVIESFLLEKNGLKILPCPQTEVGPIHPSTLDRAIKAYKPFYSVIILDMHQGFSPELLLAAQYASTFIAVTVSSEHRIYPFATTLNQLMSHRVSKKNLHIVINRSHRGENDVRRVRTGIQDVLGETFNHFHVLPYVEELSHDDDPDFVPISDMKGAEPYPSAFLKMAEAVTGLSLRKSGEGRTDKPSSSKKTSTSKSSSVGFLSTLFGGAPKKKPVKKGAKKR
jgi:MinD-like ATPase involved in chromosome partitioning or flagellar assembly